MPSCLQHTTTAFRRLTLTGICLLVTAAAPWLRAQRIVPQALPDPGIRGFSFPESEATLTGWITEMSRETAVDAADAAGARINLHGWGLWTALTMETAQFSDGQRLRVFETWPTPEDLTSHLELRSIGSLAQVTRRRTPLRQLEQLRGRVEPGERSALAAGESVTGRVVGFVKFDPTAADHILRQRLLDLDALDTLLQGGAQQVPVFPATGLAIKSIYQIVRASDLVDGRYYSLKAWSGPPDALQPWSPASWPGCVWVDLLDGGSGGGAIDETPQPDGSTRTVATTYPLSSFIHYRLSASEAEALNREKPGTGASDGDQAILVAMHAAGREIARWTWQTYWWTPAPDKPPAPSSAVIASQRPPQLRGAPRHYAMALAYTMLTPDQPYVGGENAGAAVYAYNPWIEARFAPADLPDSRRGFDPNGRPADNNYGVQTNCMSCHAQATYNPNKRNTAPRFTGARYVDLIDPQFVGTLQVDFLWSIARHAVRPPPPAVAAAPVVDDSGFVSPAPMPVRFPVTPILPPNARTTEEP